MNFIITDTGTMVFTHDDGNTIEIEMLYNSEDELDEAFTKKALLSAYEESFGNSTVARADKTNKAIDDVYMSSSIARKDYTINSDEGTVIVERLEATWPGIIPNYRVNEQNLVSEFTPLRVPYINPSISYYDMDEPSAALIATYSLPYQNYRRHYGLKIDTVTNAVLIKVHIHRHEMLKAHSEICKEMEASIPIYGNHFFGLIYNSDGELDPMIDVYFHADYELAREWVVDSMGLAMPYTDMSLDPKRTFWGAVYNTTNKRFTHIKAYIRNYIED